MNQAPSLVGRVRAFLVSFTPEPADAETTRRVVLMVGISLIGIVTLIPFAIVAFAQGDLGLGLVDVVALTALSANLLDARRFRRFDRNIWFGTLAAAALFLYAFLTGGINLSGFVWYYTFPLMAAYLLGARRATIATFLMLVPVVLLFAFDSHLPALASYGLDFKMRFIPSFLVVFLFAVLFEYTSERNRTELHTARETLESRVRERTEELTVANQKLQVEVRERQAAEQEVRQARDYLQKVIDGFPEGIMVINPDHTIALANRTVRETQGGRDPVARGAFCHQAFHQQEAPCSGEAHPCPLENVLRERAPVSVEHVHHDEHGNEVTLEIIAAPIFDDSGEVAQVIESSRDITERRRVEAQRLELEARVLQSQKLESLGLLAGGIAHDFNNLLMGVLGNADSLLARLPTADPSRAVIGHIHESAQRAADLSHQMLAYSGKARFTIETIDLNRLVEDMLPLLETAISKKAAVRLRLAAELPSIKGDATQIRQVLMNLVINASEAIGDLSGVITIETGVSAQASQHPSQVHWGKDLAEGEHVYVGVCDTGPGLNLDTIERIFDPFFTTKFTGRGLGLAVVQGVVRGHRGAIDVSSQPGQGAEFRIYLPKDEADRRPRASRGKAASPASESLPRGDGLILVADDERAVRDVASMILGHHGFSVVFAEDGRRAVERFRERAAAIRAVLLDMTMPEMSGQEVLREIRQIRPDVKVVLSSGYAEQEVPPELLKDGLAVFIQKPYRASALLEKLQELLGDTDQENRRRIVLSDVLGRDSVGFAG